MAQKILSVEFVKSAAKPEQFLPTEVPEVAFTGRSNVGKSSLLNVLVQRHSLAHTSKTPGKTRLVNFFDVRLGSAHLRLVDLPGYGFAKAKGEVRKGWPALIETYLKDRPNLRLVCALVDCRHAASPLDRQLMEWLGHFQIPHIVVLTKSDKISKSQWAKNAQLLRRGLGLEPDAEMLAFSALKKIGRDPLWKAILARL